MIVIRDLRAGVRQWMLAWTNLRHGLWLVSMNVRDSGLDKVARTARIFGCCGFGWRFVIENSR